MIELKNLTVGYGTKQVLSDISLTFPCGQVTVLLGPNGCGKSTLLKTAMGLIPPLSGEIYCGGRLLSTLTPAELARQAAYLPQNRNLPNISARRLVMHGRFPYLSFPRHYRPEDRAAVERALIQADAMDLADCPVPQLSGGQRQKVYLAMALAQETPAIFMDEPTAFLDVRHQLDVMRTARKLAEQGKTVVLVLHDLCMALRGADQAAVFGNGQLRWLGTGEEVFTSGVLEEVFDVKVHRLASEDGWQYYCV